MPLNLIISCVNLKRGRESQSRPISNLGLRDQSQGVESLNLFYLTEVWEGGELQSHLSWVWEYEIRGGGVDCKQSCLSEIEIQVRRFLVRKSFRKWNLQ